MTMELHSNIPALPFAKILHLVPIDVPTTPTPTKVLEPLLAKVLVPPSIEAPAPPIHKVSNPPFIELPLIFSIMDVC
jgi:hypothetical protein